MWLQCEHNSWFGGVTGGIAGRMKFECGCSDSKILCRVRKHAALMLNIFAYIYQVQREPPETVACATIHTYVKKQYARRNKMRFFFADASVPFTCCYPFSLR